MAEAEFFGSDEQRAVLRRGRALADLLGDDPRYSYYGRTVGLVTPGDGTVDRLAALVRVQGNSNYAHVADADLAGLGADLTARGFQPTHYRKWEGGAAALEAARKVAAGDGLPEDLTMVRLDAATPAKLLASLADMALGCGVLPLAGSALRGIHRRAICLAAVERAGRVVSVAAAAAFAHADHPVLAGQAWWGMLATHPDRRGQKLSLILGAETMLAMQADFGFTDFMTGVEPGNAASEAVCRRMGLKPGGFHVLGCADPQALSGGRMTK